MRRQRETRVAPGSIWTLRSPWAQRRFRKVPLILLRAGACRFGGTGWLGSRQ